MTNIINEALIPFKDTFLPCVWDMISQVTMQTTEIIKTFATLTNNNDVEDENRKLLEALKHHHNLIMHSLIYESDILNTVGKQRVTERYINFIDGNPVEVPKSQFIGLPEEEGNSAG